MEVLPNFGDLRKGDFFALRIRASIFNPARILGGTRKKKEGQTVLAKRKRGLNFLLKSAGWEIGFLGEEFSLGPLTKRDLLRAVQT